MKAKLGPVVAFGTLLAAAFLGALHTGSRGAQSADEHPDANPPEGGELLAACHDTLGSLASLEVQLTQQVYLFDERINGTGTYVQSGPNAQRTRLEWRFSSGERVTSYLQIHDGRFIYTRQDDPNGTRLTQVDMQRARKALAESHPQLDADESLRAATPGALGGGLYKLIDGIFRDFEFANPESVKWGEQDVWVVQGRWKRDILKLRFGIDSDQPYNEAVQALPPQVPTHVEVSIGVDPQLPHFPYRIDFLRTVPQAQGWSADLISRLDVSGIRHRVTIPQDLFDFSPSEDNSVVDDQTAAFVAEQQQFLSERR